MTDPKVDPKLAQIDNHETISTLLMLLQQDSIKVNEPFHTVGMDKIAQLRRDATQALLEWAEGLCVGARKAQLDKDLLAWHNSDTDGDYAMYFKDEGDSLLEAKPQKLA